MRLHTLFRKSGHVISSPWMLWLAHKLYCSHDKWNGEVGSIRRILVSGQMGIGNMVMFTPFLRSLRAGFPQAHIAIVFTKRNGSEQIIKGSHLVNEIIELHSAEKPSHERYLLGIELGLRGWDMGIVRFHGAKPEILAALVYGGVRYRVGHISSGGWTSKYDYLFNVPVLMSPESHDVDRYLAIAHTIGIPTSDRKQVVHVENSDRTNVIAIMDRLGIPKSSDFVAIHPGTALIQPWKRWPIEKWNALMRILNSMSVPVVVLGSSEERQLVAQVCQATAAVNAAGEFTLRESACVLALSRLLVCTDSGLMHIAAAMGTPVIAIWGPTDINRTAPIGQGHRIIMSDSCLQGPCQRMDDSLAEGCHYETCMNDIQPHHIIAQVRQTLNRNVEGIATDQDCQISVLRVRKDL